MKTAMNRVSCLLVLTMFAFAARQAEANVILTQETWTAAGTAGWTATNSTRDGASYATNIANVGSRLRISGGDASVNAEEDYIFVDSGPLAGNQNYLSYNGSNVTSIAFDFYTISAGTNQIPNYGQLSVYFVSDKGGSNWIWYYTIDITAGTTSYLADLMNYSGWWNTQGAHWNQASFNTDLGDVDEIGILLTYWPNIGNQTYEIDNFTINTLIPEPRDFAIILAALLSLALVFRRRLSDAMDRLKGHAGAGD